MNKTKRKIFETSMELFAKKGYDATSIEEITATVGVAKGTLYYHFSSKEGIFNFLVEEGMKLLKNSIDIKTSKLEKATDKIKAIILIQIKVIIKYENLITIVLNQVWGNEQINKFCQQYVFKHIETIQKVVEEGIKNGEIVPGNPEAIATEIFGLTCSSLMYKLKTGEEIDIQKLYNQYGNDIIKGIVIK